MTNEVGIQDGHPLAALDPAVAVAARRRDHAEPVQGGDPNFFGEPVIGDPRAQILRGDSAVAVESAEPGVRGDTANNVTKPATLETGAVINVPLFVNPGDKIRIDTRTGQYVSRVK